MLALWALLKPQQSARRSAPRRCRCSVSWAAGAVFLREPLELEAKSNPEHGLRLILTFKPETSFLVPARSVHRADEDDPRRAARAQP